MQEERRYPPGEYRGPQRQEAIWGNDEQGSPFPRPHEQMAAGIESWRVVCTDRGQHAERLLGKIFDRRASEHGDVYASPETLVLAKTGDGNRRFHQRNRAQLEACLADLPVPTPVTSRWVCKVCRRDTRLRPESLAVVLDLLRDAGSPRRVLDLSLLGKHLHS